MSITRDKYGFSWQIYRLWGSVTWPKYYKVIGNIGYVKWVSDDK
jgi:hypothetical protein